MSLAFLGSIEMCKLNDSSFNFNRFIPLHHAALSGNGEIVMALLEFATDVNAKDKKGFFQLYTFSFYKHRVNLSW